MLQSSCRVKTVQPDDHALRSLLQAFIHKNDGEHGTGNSPGLAGTWIVCINSIDNIIISAMNYMPRDINSELPVEKYVKIRFTPAVEIIKTLFSNSGELSNCEKTYNFLAMLRHLLVAMRYNGLSVYMASDRTLIQHTLQEIGAMMVKGEFYYGDNIPNGKWALHTSNLYLFNITIGDMYVKNIGRLLYELSYYGSANMMARL